MTIPELVEALLKTGLKQEDLAARVGGSQTSISRWKSGKQDPSGRQRDALRALAVEMGIIASMPNAIYVVKGVGYVGAGAEVLPVDEDLPAEGLFSVELLVPVSDDVVAFRVRGNSMFPRFHEDDVILVHRAERPVGPEHVNAEAVVKLTDGRRFLKTIRRGYAPGRYNLESWNAPLLEDVEIEWVSEVHLIVPARRVRFLEKPARIVR